MNKNKIQSGVSLYLAIIVMVILLAVVLGLTTILIEQMKMVREIGYSVIALSAADAGIERVLVDWAAPTTTPSYYDDSLGNGANYQVSVLRGEATAGVPDPGCTGAGLHYCITSIGTYPSNEGVRRAIEITY